MKKLFCILGCFLFIFCSIFLVKQFEFEQTSTQNISGYACVKTNDCYLYKYLIDNPLVESRYFLLEKSYFVKVIESANDEFYKVKYIDKLGYVKKSNIEFVEEVPQNPFLEEITFDIYSLSNVKLRNEPSTKNGISSIVSTIPASQKNLTYIGKISGEESIKGLGNIWYYCEYTLADNSKICGYIYSPLTNNLSPINENCENLTTVSINQFVPLNSLLYLNINTKNLIILIILIPSVYVLYLFTKPTKILKD